jgi:hypothetical protein
MSDDTPETIAAIIASNGQWSFVLKECSQRLERERDEARGILVEIRDWIDVASTRPRCAFSMDEVAQAINLWGDKIRETLKEASK